MSNNPFERKQQISGASHLELNRAHVENESWDPRGDSRTRRRTRRRAIETWVAPLPGIKSAREGGFDWTRIDMAIEAIPYRRWTI